MGDAGAVRIGSIRETVLMDYEGDEGYACACHPVRPSRMAMDASKWLTFSEEQFIRAWSRGKRIPDLEDPGTTLEKGV